jgi:glycolate oxidase
MTGGASQGGTPAGTQKTDLHTRLGEILGADRWVDGLHPAVCPNNVAEVSTLLGSYPGRVLVVGGGSNFPSDYTPPNEALTVLTGSLREINELDVADQVLRISAGWDVVDVNAQLALQGYVVPALTRFQRGTIGGRLAATSSLNRSAGADGWVHSLLGLTVVLPGGELLTLGGRCIKDVAGYDMRYMFTGSRGAVGIIVEALFRCIPSDLIPSASETAIPSPGSYDPVWRRLFDPRERMQPGA